MMARFKNIFGVLLFFYFALVCKQVSGEVNIIPKPNKCLVLKGSVIIKDSLSIILQTKSGDALQIAEMLRSDFKTFTGLSAFITDNNFARKPLLYLSINSLSGALGDEGYVLTIRNDSIKIEANAKQGLFYGVQSLLQLVSSAQIGNSNRIVLNNCLINDYPRYPWRGMHLDVSRHFFNKAFVFKYLDAMAMHKLNVFHWHLADDQGWRIEIRKYPKLTDIGAWREDKEDQEWSNAQYPATDKSKKLYGGYFTQDDIREVVAYAAQRQILIVPEIDVPGHSGAAICAYPEVSCTKYETKKDAKQPITLCAGDENTYKFLEDVFSELCELFPGPYIHIGGDECNHTPWETCKLCQQRMTDNNIKDVKELQNYMNQRLEVFLTSKHKRLIGWEEIAEGNLSPSSMIMSWQGEKAGVIAARKKLQVVMAPNTHLYFDNYFDTPDNEDKYQNNPKVGTLQTIYGYNPDPASLGPADLRSIYGVQGCLWSESLFSEKIAEKVLMPRLCGLSEIAWTMDENKDYSDFLNRLNTHYNYLDKAHYTYFIEMPGFIGNLENFKNETKVELVNKFCKGEIYYTLDGSEPGSQSRIYTKPVKLTQSGILKAKVIFGDSESNTRTYKIIKQ